jgi:hypothetical protein
MSSQINSEDRYVKQELPRLGQGDILRDVELVEWAQVIDAEPKQLEIQRRQLPYVVVLSQECDLHQDQQNRADPTRLTQDKYLYAVLLCPAYPAAKVRSGEHLEMPNIKCEQMNSARWRSVVLNNVDRYHFLPAFDPLQVPEVVLDFKHFITAPREILSKLKPDAYVASLGQLFREHLSQRFAGFLARIALPDPEDEVRQQAVVT